jgi:hypothetical protein
MDHETKEWEVANFHGLTSDAYAYVWMVPGSLFSWITLWYLCHTLNSCNVAYFHASEACPWKLATRPFFMAWNRSHDVFHENMLPFICSLYDTGFNVLSMKIKHPPPFFRSKILITKNLSKHGKRGITGIVLLMYY